MTKAEISTLITHVSGYKPKDPDDKHITFNFLKYLVENNHITKEEYINIKRFYIDKYPYCAKSILHFILVKQLYNKHIKQLENGIKTELDKEST